MRPQRKRECSEAKACSYYDRRKAVKVKECVCNELYQELKSFTDEPYMKDAEGSSFLITGGSGFIAYYIVMALLLLNDEQNRRNKITIMVRSEKKAAEKYGELLGRSDISVMVHDVCIPLGADTQRFDYIIHAAGAAAAAQFEEDPIGVFSSNVVGSSNFIDFIRKNECRSMVYMSSFTVYGNIADDACIVDENYTGADDWRTNRCSYSLGKRSSEFLCMAAVRKFGCPIKIVRPGFVYGASSPNDMRVYSEIIRSVAEGKPIVLRSAGLLFRSMIYVTDVVRGIFAALFNGTDGEAYNIANEFVSIREFAQIACECSPSKDAHIVFADPDDAGKKTEHTPVGQMSSEKLRGCGWKPMVPINSGIKTAAKIYSYTYGTLA